MRGLFVGVVLSLGLAVGPGSAHADRIVRGYLVRVEAKELYFNLGTAHGISAGDQVRLKRPITLRHPVTRKELSDWLPVGSTTMTVVGAALSMAEVDDSLLSLVAAGDRVEVLVREDEPAPVPAKAIQPAPVPDAPPAEPLPSVDAETAEVLQIFSAMVGKSLDVRIAAWTDYLENNPKSSFVADIRSDLTALERQQRQRRPAENTDLEQRSLGGIIHKAPARGRGGDPLGLVFLIDEPEKLAAAWLHYRVRGTDTFRRGKLRREQSAYLRGELPASVMQAPGVEYFVEIATERGASGAAIGSAADPIAVEVADESAVLAEAFAAQRNRSRIAIKTTYLDFSTFDDRPATSESGTPIDRTDRFFLFEIDFLYRLRGTLHGIRSGFGSISGTGGLSDPVAVEAEASGFNYGFSELEFNGPYSTGYLLRFVAGVGKEGFGLGMDGRFRLGAEEDTNLSLGVSTLEQIGFLSDVRMQWNAVADVPVGLSIALTDRPSRGDVGVRFTADVGYRASNWVRPTLRLSYQARTVVHSGLGAGLGLVFDW